MNKSAMELAEAIRNHWCDEFPYGEACKHCLTQFELCVPISDIINNNIQSSTSTAIKEES